MSSGRVELIALSGIPVVTPGADLVELVASAFMRRGVAPMDGDVLVVAQKIISKAENRFVDLRSVYPSEASAQLAIEVEKDPRLVEVILSQSTRVVRKAPNVLIVEHRLGFVMANAGVDQSNTGPDDGETVLLLPEDPDASASRLRDGLAQRLGLNMAIVVNDSFGRPWRLGTVGVAIGAAGLPSLIDKRGETDLFGRTLKVTVIAYADEIASAASILMGQADEGLPAVLVRGLSWRARALPARSLLRPPMEDLFQ